MTNKSLLLITMALAAVLTGSILLGCQIGRFGPNWGRPLVVDTDCPPSVTDALIVAASDWDRALPEAGLQIATSGPVSVRCNGAPQDSGRGHVLIATTHRGGILQLWPDGVSQDLLERSLRHELGHYLGAQGDWAHPPDGQAMRGDWPPAWTCINEVDIDAVCRGRGTATKPWGCRARPGELLGTCPPGLPITRPP